MRKLYRSRRDRMLLGLCGGMADAYNIEATLLRLLLVVASIFSGGTLIIVYLIAGMVIPSEPKQYHQGPYNGYGGGYQQGGYNPNGYGTPPYGNGGAHGQGGYPGGQPGAPGSNGGYRNPPPDWTYAQNQQPKPPSSELDNMMDDLEKKALRREIEELKAKMAKFDKEDV